jgi:hypothetical protein
MVFNATFTNIYVISWQSGLLMEKTGVPGENHRGTRGVETLPSQESERLCIRVIDYSSLRF